MAKVLLVTGGSRGIGAAICRLGARDGYDVAVNYAGRAEAAEAVAADVRAAGRRAITIQGDIADEARGGRDVRPHAPPSSARSTRSSAMPG